MNFKLLRLALAAAVLAISLFVAACGSSDSDDSADAGPDPITLAPADVPFYAQMVVRPEGDLKDDLNSAVGKLTGDDDPGAQIIDEINSSLAEDTDLTYEDDIEPWLGSRAGVFVSGFQFDTEEPDVALVVATTDTDAAQGFVDASIEESGDSTSDETYEGVSYKLDSDDGTAIGIVDDFLVAHPGFAVDDPRPLLPEPAHSLIDGRGALRTFPNRHGLDGFFALRMKRG